MCETVKVVSIYIKMHQLYLYNKEVCIESLVPETSVKWLRQLVLIL